MTPRVEATIDLNALSHNFAVVKNCIPSTTHVMPMVKANAYGHGLIEVAQHLEEADVFGVATLPEAIALREAGIRQPIMVMCGFRSPDELLLFCEFNLTAIVHHLDQIMWLTQLQLPQPLCIWLKVDTGMHRLGVSPTEFAAALEILQHSVNVQQPVGVMTHLATADSDVVFAQEQLQLFDSLTDHLDCPKSVANSAAILTLPQTHHQLVRPGIMLYGVSSFAGKTGQDLGLKPVMTLLSHLLAYKSVRRGECVGYGCTWQAPSDVQVGIVAVGYGDGYPRSAQNKGVVRIEDHVCPIIGRISMDLLAIDISSVCRPYIGQDVLLWGDALPAEVVAQAADTIAYDLFCQLTHRVQRFIAK